HLVVDAPVSRALHASTEIARERWWRGDAFREEAGVVEDLCRQSAEPEIDLERPEQSLLVSRAEVPREPVALAPEPTDVCGFEWIVATIAVVDVERRREL